MKIVGWFSWFEKKRFLEVSSFECVLWKQLFQGFVAGITPPCYRGFAGGLFQIGIYFGTFLCLLLSPYVGWQILSLVGLACGLSMSCGLVFMKKTCERLTEENMSQQRAAESSKNDQVGVRFSVKGAIVHGNFGYLPIVGV